VTANRHFRGPQSEAATQAGIVPAAFVAIVARGAGPTILQRSAVAGRIETGRLARRMGTVPSSTQGAIAMFFPWKLPRRKTTRTGARRRRRANRLSPTAVEFLEPRAMLSANVILVTPGPGTPIQDAVDSAQAGDTILLGKGVYQEQITIDKDLTIAGKTNDARDVEIRPPVDDGDGDGITVTSDVHHVALKNFRVTGWADDGITVAEDSSEAVGVEKVILANVIANHNRGDGIELNDVGDVRLTKVCASNNGDDGLEVAEGKGKIDITQSQFNCNGTGVENHGLEIKEIAGNVNLNKIEANANGDDGLRIAGAQDVCITSSKFSNNVGNSNADGVDFQRVRNVRVSCVTACGNAEDGFDIDNGTGDISIKDSVFSNNGVAVATERGDGIDLHNIAGKVTLCKVHACENQGSGVTIEQADAVDIFFSKFCENGADGIQVESVPTVLIKDSTGNRNGLFGLSVTDSSRLTVKYSTFLKNASGAISLKDVAQYIPCRVIADGQKV
jgi:hypothetical protein